MSLAQFQHDGRLFALRTWAESDAIHEHMTTTGTFYESEALAFIRSRGLHGTYLDIGANIGNHSVYFSALCQPSLVVAIDGNPAIVLLLRENLRVNRQPGIPVWLLPGFISSKAEVYFTQESDRNVGGSFVRDTADTTAVPSRAWTLDTIARDLPRVDLIKIDLENYEMEVFQSGLATIRRHHPEILVESFSDQYPLVQAFLAAEGYAQLTEFKNYNWYFVHVGRPAIAVHSALMRLPFALSSRLGWRWLVFACRLARLAGRGRIRHPSPPTGGPSAPLQPL